MGTVYLIPQVPTNMWPESGYIYTSAGQLNYSSLIIISLTIKTFMIIEILLHSYLHILSDHKTNSNQTSFCIQWGHTLCLQLKFRVIFVTYALVYEVYQRVLIKFFIFSIPPNHSYCSNLPWKWNTTIQE